MKIEKAKCLAAVEAELEFPGKLPDNIWKNVCGNREAITELLRITVRITKRGIKDRIEAIGE